jgi:DNA-binding CsgD family transcriptional regulator
MLGRDDQLALCAARIDQRRHTVVRGHSLSGRTSFGQALSEHFDGGQVISGRRELAALDFGVFAATLGEIDPLARLSALAAALGQRSVLIVDNPHWLDSQTLAAISMAAEHVPLVAMSRGDQPIPPALSRWVCDDAGAQVSLEPLGDDVIRQLLRTSCPAIAPMALWLAVRFSAGRPGIAAYLMRRAAREGSWAFLVPDIEPDQALIDLVNENCDSERLLVLGVLGLIGEAQFQGLVGAVGLLGLEHARTELVIDDGGVVRPVSALIARCARHIVAPSALFDAASRLDITQLQPLGQVAVADACRDAIDRSTLLGAARQAAQLHHARTAMELLDRAGTGQSIDDIAGFVDVLQALGRYDQIPSLLTPLRNSEMSSAQRAEFARLCATAQFSDSTLEPDDQITAACAQIDAWTVDGTDEAALVAEQAALLWSAGRHTAAVRLIDNPELMKRSSFRVRTFGIRASERMAVGDIDSVRAEAVSLLPKALSMGFASANIVVGTLLVALVFEFQFDEAERLLDLGEATLAPGMLDQRAHLLGSRAAMLITRGRPDAAMAAIDEAIDIVHFGGDRSLLPILGALGTQAALNSVAHHATSAVDDYLELMSTDAPGKYRVFNVLNDPIEISARAARGDRKRAIGEMLSRAQLARSRDHYGEEIRLLYGAVCLGATTSLRSQRMTTLKREISSPVLRMMIDRIVATERADPFGLMEVSKRLAEHGAVLEAGECAAQAAGAARQVGRIEYSTECDLRSIELLSTVGGAETTLLRLLRQSDNRFQLTSRERSIVRMAQQGMTNKQIAEAMFIGVRTVEGHLLRSYAKLGVTSRADLRASV